MEELTLEEIIKYSVRIQQDCFIFYRRIGKKLQGNELKNLTDDLADHSADRLSKLKNLLSECFL
jgi:rubrerythrin